MNEKGRSRLVPRVALSSLVAFLAVGTILSVVVSRQLRGREEGAAMFHAQFVANSILSREFTPADLRVAMAVTDAPYQKVLADARAWILRRPVVRIKVWSADGTVVFSDEPRLVGRRFDVDSDLKEGFAG